MSKANKDQYYDKLEQILLWTVKHKNVNRSDYNDLWVKSGLGRNKMWSERNRQVMDNVLARPSFDEFNMRLTSVAFPNHGVPCAFKLRINRVWRMHNYAHNVND